VPLAHDSSVPGRTFKYLHGLRKCFEILFFQQKLGMDRIEAIQMVQCGNAYEEFWEDDSSPTDEDYSSSSFSVN
jgi:hypothetical protein